MTQPDINTTKQHNEIKKWIIDNGGTPARLAYDSTAIASDPLTVWFQQEKSDVPQTYQALDWEEFFSIFDHYNLKFEHNNLKGDDRYFAFKGS